jgi:tRNA-specific 2-thiouridylase
MGPGKPLAVVGISGGVDSCVAAALLLEQGYEVRGVFLRLPRPEGPSDGPDTVDTARLADGLGIEVKEVDVRALFERQVVSEFVAGYAAGRTPNPCVLCNRRVKFAALLHEARADGAELVATGHYARRAESRHGNGAGIAAGAAGHDQSYFLCLLTQEQVEHAAFPVGGMTKDDVRREAVRLGLGVHDRPDSQDLCFLSGADYRELLRQRCPEACRPGPIVHVSGRRLGEHQGIAAYTLGQRKGLGVAHAEPLYVAALRPDRNEVVVGERQHVIHGAVTVAQVNWMARREPGGPVRAQVRIRHNHKGAAAQVSPVPGGRARVVFAEPQLAPCPGQAAAFYDGHELLGGGLIDEVLG